jgi:hypothetical protein
MEEARYLFVKNTVTMLGSWDTRTDLRNYLDVTYHAIITLRREYNQILRENKNDRASWNKLWFSIWDREKMIIEIRGVKVEWFIGADQNNPEYAYIFRNIRRSIDEMDGIPR